ncbi:hypothetical protein D3C75_1278380 [compost metagenome]
MMLSLCARSLATKESMALYLAERLACRSVMRSSRVSCCFFRSVRLSVNVFDRSARVPVVAFA